MFLINVPVGLAALVAAGRLVPESRSDSARRLDLGGVALGSIVLGLIVVPLVEGRAAGWPWWVPAAFAAALPAAALWLAYERRVSARGGAPLIELGLFRQRGFRVGVGLALVFWMVTSFFLLLGLYLQDGLGYSPIQSGLLFTPIAVPFVAASLSSGRLAGLGDERMLALGAATASAGLLVAALSVAGTGGGFPGAALLLAFVLVGSGCGLFMPTVITAVLRRIPAGAAGSASGVLSTAQQVGNALGVATAGTAFFSALGHGSGGAAYGDAFALAAAIPLAVTAVASVLALRLRERPARLSLAPSSAGLGSSGGGEAGC